MPRPPQKNTSGKGRPQGPRKAQNADGSKRGKPSGRSQTTAPRRGAAAAAPRFHTKRNAESQGEAKTEYKGGYKGKIKAGDSTSRRRTWENSPPAAGYAEPPGPRGPRASRPPRGAGSEAETLALLSGEWLHGINPVRQALEAGRRHFHELRLKDGVLKDRLAELEEMALTLGIPVRRLPVDVLDQLCQGESHQGVALRCGHLGAPDAEELLLSVAKYPLVVALDEVEDPRNLGAIVRNCAVFGASAMVITKRRSAPLSPAASKASAGLLEAFPVFAATNLSRFLEEARQHGYWVVGAAVDGTTPLEAFRHQGPLVLVLGSESKGLRPLVASHCDDRLAIDTVQDTSLNVASASAVMLYQLTRRATVAG